METEYRRVARLDAKKAAKVTLHGMGAVVGIVIYGAAAVEDKVSSLAQAARRRFRALLRELRRHVRYMAHTFDRYP